VSDKFLLSIIEHVLNKVFGPVGIWVPNMEPATLGCRILPVRHHRLMGLLVYQPLAKYGDFLVAMVLEPLRC
jgi:hypothetical protein